MTGLAGSTLKHADPRSVWFVGLTFKHWTGTLSGADGFSFRVVRPR